MFETVCKCGAINFFRPALFIQPDSVAWTERVNTVLINHRKNDIFKTFQMTAKIWATVNSHIMLQQFQPNPKHYNIKTILWSEKF
jgi:hypothetical protein